MITKMMSRMVPTDIALSPSLGWADANYFCSVPTEAEERFAGRA
jgi:hypothetical protein